MNGKKVIVGLVIGLTVGLIAGGVVWFVSGGGADVGVFKPKPTATPTRVPPSPTPQASPTPDLDRSDLSIEVLNGSGEPGVAGDAEELLEDLGYELIETGNADSYDYDQIQVSVKESNKDYLQLLLNDLKDEYSISSESAFLEEDYEYDAQVIIGTE